ncbi:MAG: tetratricopeptide repeat protein [Chromatiales bacterium]|nr:tetratricopeptide repeat protein [Chromatiales bacterium]
MFRSALFGLSLVLLAAHAVGASPASAQAAPADITTLERAIAENADNVDLRLRLAEAYLAANRADDAIVQYEAVIASAGKKSAAGKEASRRMRYTIATRHAERGELAEAITLFDELAKEYPDNVLVHYSVGVAYLLSGTMDKAHVAFEHVLKLDPKYVNAYINLASVYEREGNMEQAVAALQRAIEIAPGTQSASRARTRLEIIEGRLLVAEGNLADAAAAFERALQADPANREALVELGAAQGRLGDNAAERATYVRIVNAYPDDQRSRLYLADRYVAAGEYREAYDQLETLFEQHPSADIASRAQDLLMRAQATAEGRRAAEEHLQAKIRELETRVAASPEDTVAWKGLALLHLRRSDNQAAMGAFEKVRNLDPQDWRSRFALASIYDQLGRFVDAAAEYEVILTLDTGEEPHAHAAAELKTVEAKRAYVEGKFAEATKRFEQILADDPDSGLAHFYLGMIYSQEEQTLRAVDAYQEVIRIVPSHVGARLQLAANYERLNREEDAIDEYNKILRANPSADIAESVKRAMENARQRLRGVSASIGYSMSYDDNTALSDTRRVEDFRSDLSLNLAFQYRTESNLRWRLLLSPSYSNYHLGQYDYLNSAATLSLGMTRGRYNLVGGFAYRGTEGLITKNRIGRMNTLFAEASTRMRLPPLLQPWSSDRISSNIGLSASYSDYDSSSSPFFSTYTSSAGVSVNQPLSPDSVLRTGYQYVINANKELVGNDYAYTSHNLSLGMDYRVSWGVLNANYGFSLLDYTYLDSFSQFTRRRQNLRHNLALGANWRFRPNINLFSTVSWSKNGSNLPVGFVLSSEDVIEGLQSSSLSNYSRMMLATGISVAF